jgi:hypothetical protein
MMRSDLPMSRGPPRPSNDHGGAQLGPAHDHDNTGLGAPVMEPSPGTVAEIRARRTALLRFWVLVAAMSAAFVPAAWVWDLPAADRLLLTAIFGGAAALVALRGYLQYCRINLMALYENGIAPPLKPHPTLSRAMDLRVPYSDFSKVVVEHNDIERKELAEEIFFRFTLTYADGGRLVLEPSILGRGPAKDQLKAFFDAVKEGLGKTIPDRVEVKTVLPDGKRPVATVSSARLGLRVGPQVREFPWDRIAKLRIRPARSGAASNFEAFDVLVGSEWVHLETSQIPRLNRRDAMAFLEEVMRVSRARRVEIIQE